VFIHIFSALHINTPVISTDGRPCQLRRGGVRLLQPMQRRRTGCSRTYPLPVWAGGSPSRASLQLGRCMAYSTFWSRSVICFNALQPACFDYYKSTK